MVKMNDHNLYLEILGQYPKHQRGVPCADNPLKDTAKFPIVSRIRKNKVNILICIFILFIFMLIHIFPIRPALIPGFYSPLDEMPVHCRVTPSIKFAGTHLYTWVERDTVRVKCLAQENNTMSPAMARARTARSGDERNNHKATAPPTTGSCFGRGWIPTACQRCFLGEIAIDQTKYTKQVTGNHFKYGVKLKSCLLISHLGSSPHEKP